MTKIIKVKKFNFGDAKFKSGDGKRGGLYITRAAGQSFRIAKDGETVLIELVEFYTNTIGNEPTVRLRISGDKSFVVTRPELDAALPAAGQRGDE